MMRLWMIAFVLGFGPTLAMAQQILPALYDVTGVAVGDVLNIRAKPKPGAAIIGRLPRTAKGVEVIAVNAARTWATVNSDEGTGYAALRFLAQQTGPDWGAMETPLHCIGTEPFWGLDLDPGQGTAAESDPDGIPRTAAITAVWPNNPYNDTAAVAIQGDGLDGLATLHGAVCSDGMSDRSYGIAVDLFLRDDTGAASAAFHGCCSLLP